MSLVRASQYLRLFSAICAAAFVASCGYRPAHFADRPPVLSEDDEQPIALPRRGAFIPELHDASVYVRRELVNALEPRRPGEAKDVNALDEVPASSWFRRAAQVDKPLLGYKREGPPATPFTVTSDAPTSESPNARVILDARGRSYELVPDEPDRRGMRSGAGAAASRLFYAIGYRTAEVHVVTDEGGARFLATRWPPGEDLGPTPIASLRDDDPNDRIEHRDRRSLRALELAAAWLDLVRLPPRMLRDVYVGPNGEGHVEHMLVGIDGALGVTRYDAALAWLHDRDREDSNFFARLFGLGLSPKRAAYPPDTRNPSLGLYDEFVALGSFSVSPPFEPADRMRAGDAYWMAKRIASIPQRVLGRAVISTRLPPLAQHALLGLLAARRAQVVAWGYDQVSPLEPGLVSPPNEERGYPARVQLVDLAVATGMASSERASYGAKFSDSEGRVIGRVAGLRAKNAVVRVEFPEASRFSDYLVVQVTALRGGRALPHPVELHLQRRAGELALVGVRHD